MKKGQFTEDQIIAVLLAQEAGVETALLNLFGLTLSQGRLMNLLRPAQERFRAGREAAIATLRRADVIASDEIGVRIEGSNAYHRALHSAEAVFHQASPTRGAVVCER